MIEDLIQIRKTLEKCKETFKEYAHLHFKKGTIEGNVKAQRNAEMADECIKALALLK